MSQRSLLDEGHTCPSGPWARAPKVDCQGCWDSYNRQNGLPGFNRESKSHFKWSAHKEQAFLAWHLRGLTLEHNKCAISAGCVIGLDLSLQSTGLAYIKLEGDKVFYHTERFGMSLPNTASSQTKGYRLYQIADWVQSKVSVEPRMVLIEDHAYGKVAQRGIELAELHGAVKSALSMRVPWEVVGVTQARLAVIMNGRADKKAALRAMPFGSPFLGCYDELDALVVAMSYIKP